MIMKVQNTTPRLFLFACAALLTLGVSAASPAVSVQFVPSASAQNILDSELPGNNEVHHWKVMESTFGQQRNRLSSNLNPSENDPEPGHFAIGSDFLLTQASSTDSQRILGPSRYDLYGRQTRGRQSTPVLIQGPSSTQTSVPSSLDCPHQRGSQIE